MSCNKLFQMVCDIYSDSYGTYAERDVCLVQLLGEEEMLRKCRNLGLDKSYPVEYKDIANKIMNKENR